MSKEAMKLALEALKRMKRYGNTFGYRSNEQNPYEQVCEAIEALEALAEQPASYKIRMDLPASISSEAIEADKLLKPQPAQQEPVAFPARKAVEREIERTTSPTGMHLNDGKERVALPGGTLRHMLALIDRTSPPQRIWAGLTDEDIQEVRENCGITHHAIKTIEAKLKEKNSGD